MARDKSQWCDICTELAGHSIQAHVCRLGHAGSQSGAEKHFYGQRYSLSLSIEILITTWYGQFKMFLF